jgi:hydroxyacylglutathione hydrolase
MKVHSIVNSIFNSITYILYQKDESNAIMIDCGDIKPIIDYLSIHNLALESVFLTHTHFDHIYGLNDLLDYYPNVKIYTNEFGEKALSDPKLNISRLNEDIEDFMFTSRENICVIKGNESVPVFNKNIESFETFGHDLSCLTFLFIDYIFTGDSYIPGLKAQVHFPNSNKTDAANSEQFIKELSVDKIVCPGHQIK